MFGADVDADAHAAADVDVDVAADVDHCISELECGLAGLSQTITINEGPHRHY